MSPGNWCVMVYNGEVVALSVIPYTPSAHATRERKKSKMKLVDTRSSKRTNVARTADGSVDFEAYVGLSGQIASDGLNVAVRVVGARARYGHLDLCVTPISGSGQRWLERKNVELENDPAESLF